MEDLLGLPKEPGIPPAQAGFNLHAPTLQISYCYLRSLQEHGGQSSFSSDLPTQNE